MPPPWRLQLLRPDCRSVVDGNGVDPAVVLGERAHLLAEAPKLTLHRRLDAGVEEHVAVLPTAREVSLDAASALLVVAPRPEGDLREVLRLNRAVAEYQ